MAVPAGLVAMGGQAPAQLCDNPMHGCEISEGP